MSEAVEKINKKELAALENSVKKALSDRQNWILKTFPVDSTIKFDHNGHTQLARVIDHGDWSDTSPRLRVQNIHTGSVRWVYFFHIAKAYGCK